MGFTKGGYIPANSKNVIFLINISFLFSNMFPQANMSIPVLQNSLDLIPRQEWSPHSFQGQEDNALPISNHIHKIHLLADPYIVWDKDGNPYLLGAARGKLLLMSVATTLEQFLSLLPKTEPVHLYLPWVRPFKPWESEGICPWKTQDLCWDLDWTDNHSDTVCPNLDMAHDHSDTTDNHVHPSFPGERVIYPRRSWL